MTTIATNAETAAVANGTNPIPFDFHALSADEIGVLRDDIEQIGDYEVSLNDDGTGSITPLSDWGASTVRVYSNPNYQQPTHFTRFGPMYPDQYEPPLDRLARYIIAIREMLTRTILFPRGDVGSFLPAAEDRVSTVFGFDELGAAALYGHADFKGEKGDTGLAGAGDFTIDSLGAIPDSAPAGSTGTDNVAIIDELAEYQNVTENRNPSTFYHGGREVHYPGEAYYFSQSINLKYASRHRGMGLGQTGGEPTVLRFPANTSGMVVERYNTLNEGEDSPVSTGGDGTHIDGFLFQSDGGLDNLVKAAVRFRGRGTVTNSIFRNFPGAGLLVSADTSVPASDPFHGNANNSLAFNYSSSGNEYGSYWSGGDANAGLNMAGDASHNRRWGHYDSTFLGMTHVALHTAANGFFDAENNTTSVVSFGGRRYYAKHDASVATLQAEQPGTGSNWIDMGAGGVSAGVIPLWELDGGAGDVQYVAGGAYFADPSGASSVFVGCYYETGQAPPQIYNSIVIGGFMGNGLLDGGPHLRTTSTTGLTSQRPFGQHWTYTDASRVNIRLGGNITAAGTYTEILGWNSTVATPFNPDVFARLEQEKATGDIRFNFYNFFDAMRITGYSTAKTYGGRGQVDSRYVVEVSKFAISNGGSTASIWETYHTVPTTGYHGVGDKIFNNGAGGTSKLVVDYWLCTVAGTPGTFVPVPPFSVEAFQDAVGAFILDSNSLDVTYDDAGNALTIEVKPNVQSVVSAATVTPTFSNDGVKVTAQAVGLTLANPTGTAKSMWGWAIRIKDNGTPQTIGYGTQYRAVGVSLPTTTVANKTLYLGCIWNSDDSKVDVVSVAPEA